MGSLLNCARITQSCETLRKLGRVHTKSADRVETATFIGPSPVTLSSQLGTMPDKEVTQRSILQEGRDIKTTQSLEDLEVETNTNLHTVAASEQPELTNISVTPLRAHHTGARVVVSDTVADDVISREYDTSYLPGG